MTVTSQLAAGSSRRATTRYVEQVMGLPISLALRGRHIDDQAAHTAWAAVVASLREADRVLSTYRADSCVSRLGRGEVSLDQCPPEVGEVLALGETARIESGGAFDVWRRDVSGRPRLDPSGVVKGWAVERAARALDALVDTDHCLNAGGDLTCRVVDPASPAWRVGIEDPADPSRILAVVPVRTGAMATSANTHRGTHIVDPRPTREVGHPASGLRSITVLGPCLTWVDIEATAAFVLGAGGVAWLVDRGRSGLAVGGDGRASVFSPGS